MSSAQCPQRVSFGYTVPRVIGFTVSGGGPISTAPRGLGVALGSGRSPLGALRQLRDIAGELGDKVGRRQVRALLGRPCEGAAPLPLRGLAVPAEKASVSRPASLLKPAGR